ncbi:hypothetical protein DMB38_25785 [Streptomyces sp. WAC 06738]|uniref:hypothetical protein n=1 Tax=Streptomyces sp. WAC 06738 TaxID=2203210 RepID=UPI000F6CB73D|nr:hypothetical protein [Streptomyces sp. WAC 06738]AZM48737.1 hypothetical protein DMB38_25785 [Streptomyces sp. WAC 06738]
MTLARPGGTEKINNTSGVVYTGADWLWRDGDKGGGGNWLDDIDATNAAGDSFTLSFHSTRLKIITETFSDETTMMISVDGGPEQSVDLRSPSRVYQTTVFDTRGAGLRQAHHLSARSATTEYDVTRLARQVVLIR